MPEVELPLPVVFFFRVKIDNESVLFQEVKGLEFQLDVQEVCGGGDNSTIYYLPKKKKYPDLVLCRALAKKNEKFYAWCSKHLDNSEGFLNIELKNFQILLLGVKNPKEPQQGTSENVEEEILAVWSVKGAYPYKWSMNNLDAMKNEIAIETVSLKVQSITREQ